MSTWEPLDRSEPVTAESVLTTDDTIKSLPTASEAPGTGRVTPGGGAFSGGDDDGPVCSGGRGNGGGSGGGGGRDGRVGAPSAGAGDCIVIDRERGGAGGRNSTTLGSTSHCGRVATSSTSPTLSAVVVVPKAPINATLAG